MVVQTKTVNRAESGIAYVEFAITAFVFFALCLLVIDILRYSYQNVTAQYIVNRALRQTTMAETSAAAVEGEVSRLARDFGLRNVQGKDIKICSIGATGACDWESNESTGMGRDLISISIRLPYAFTFWDLGLTVQAEAIGRNEPF